MLISALVVLVTGMGIAGFAALAGSITFVKSVVITVPLVMLCGIIAYAGRFLCRFFPTDWVHLGRTATVQAVFIGMSVVVLITAWILYCLAITLFLPGYIDIRSSIRILPVFAAGMVLLLTFAQSTHYLVLMVEEKKRASDELLAQKLATAEAELALVKSTIHPHFLFNSLSMLTSLVRRDSVAAEKALEDLSEFLIYSVRFANRTSVPFEDEIAHVRHYARIEHLRGINDVILKVNVAECCMKYLVLPFILQPLVENALKHGVRQCTGGGTITVHAYSKDTFLFIEVTNPLPDGFTRYQKSDTSAGTGLTTLEKRLFCRYGVQAKLMFTAVEHEWIVTLKLPRAEGS